MDNSKVIQFVPGRSIVKIRASQYEYYRAYTEASSLFFIFPFKSCPSYLSIHNKMLYHWHPQKLCKPIM